MSLQRESHLVIIFKKKKKKIKKKKKYFWGQVHSQKEQVRVQWKIQRVIGHGNFEANC